VKVHKIPQISLVTLTQEVIDFINTCRLYLRLNREKVTETDKITYILRHVQRLAEVWKNNIIEELKTSIQEFTIVNKLYDKI